MRPATGADSSHTSRGMEAVKDNADQLTERVKDRAANLKRQARAGRRLGARAHPLSSDYRMTADEVARC